MIRLEKPQMDLQTILDNCTSNMNEPRKSRIENVAQTIITESQSYDSLAESGQLYTIRKHNTVDSIATKEDMEALYTQKFVPAGQPNREYYDKIKLLAPHNKCPYCGQNIVKTLDHYLPKSKYVTFTVTPYNLVPSCSDCNTLKLSSTFNEYSEQPFHPYYDNFDDEIWLKATLIEEIPIAFYFYADPPCIWDETKRTRVINNFTRLKLNDIYKIHASELYQTRFKRIKSLFDTGGKSLALSRLEEFEEDERSLRNNTWKAAMYNAIINSDWYWDTYLTSL